MGIDPDVPDTWPRELQIAEGVNESQKKTSMAGPAGTKKGGKRGSQDGSQLRAGRLPPQTPSPMMWTAIKRVFKGMRCATPCHTGMV